MLNVTNVCPWEGARKPIRHFSQITKTFVIEINGKSGLSRSTVPWLKVLKTKAFFYWIVFCRLFYFILFYCCFLLFDGTF